MSRTLGKDFERLAKNWLTERGLQLVETNYSCRSGEIDLIMLDGSTLVFVEVRYRQNARYGSAAESVGQVKQSRLIKAAQFYLLMHEQYAQAALRFDVVALSGPAETPTVNWIENAFSA